MNATVNEYLLDILVELGGSAQVIENLSTTETLLYLISLQLSSGDVVLGAENGVTVFDGKARLGGSLIENTNITGAYRLAFTDQASLAIGAAASSTIRFYAYNNIANPSNGTAAGLLYTKCTPVADINAVNTYGSAGILELNLAGAKVTAASSFNTTGHVSQLVVRNSNGQSTGPVWASRSTAVFYDAVNLAEVRVHGIKSPEYFGAGAAIATLSGVYIEAQKSAAVTTAYAVYQAGASDFNYWAGVTRFANNVLFQTDNANDIGSVGANRPRNVYVANELKVDGTLSMPLGGSASNDGFGGCGLSARGLFRNGTLVLGSSTGYTVGMGLTRAAIAVGHANGTLGTMLSRGTTVQKNSVAWDATDDGMVYYDTTLKKLQVWNGTTLAWENCN